MVVENVVDRHALVTDDKSRIKGIIDMPIAVPGHPRVGGIKVAPETSKTRPQ